MKLTIFQLTHSGNQISTNAETAFIILCAVSAVLRSDNMFSTPDFCKKQIVFIMFHEGEKLAFNNDNLVVKTKDGKIKFQCTCYRLFIVFAIGHTSITSPLIQKALKFGFYIVLLTPTFRQYAIIGAVKDGNTLLKKKQYSYTDIGLAQRIITNKINNQLNELKSIRKKTADTTTSIEIISGYMNKLTALNTTNEIMGYEGLASKLYFKNYFDNVLWQGRQPRIKRDYINSALDIGYTLLFTYVDSILLSFGFDTYCGVMHKQFYMRKSLTCDLVEPFRTIIDHQLKKSINLKQIQEDDFMVINNRYCLKWSENSRYVNIFLSAIMDFREDIFMYLQQYYRAFMKNAPIESFPFFNGKY